MDTAPGMRRAAGPKLAWAEGGCPQLPDHPIGRGRPSPTTQELLPELDGRPHPLDLVARVRAKRKAGDAYLVVFIEAHGKRRPEFLVRVFRYFALLHIKTGSRKGTQAKALEDARRMRVTSPRTSSPISPA